MNDGWMDAAASWTNITQWNGVPLHLNVYNFLIVIDNNFITT